METTQVLVLADGDGVGAVSNKRGHLFEQFVAQLLNALGYAEPRSENLNVTSEGIELDVFARSRVTDQALVAECKAYSANVPASMLTSFLGKYAIRRGADPQLVGLFIALPRLTADGNEQAAAAKEVFPAIRVLGSFEIVELLESAGLLPSSEQGPETRSDLSVIVTEHGLALAARELDARTRKATRVAVWSKSGSVPDPILELISRAPLADGLAVSRSGDEQLATPLVEREAPTIITVRGSGSDFEYQLPAAPRYFVGRKSVEGTLSKLISERTTGGTAVINAKSGWGKSSLALQLARKTEQSGGVAVVVDSRTAAHIDFVPAVLEHLAGLAVAKRLIVLPDDATFTSLASAVRTIEHSSVRGRSRPLLVFFDQFENVFRDEQLTRAFRDLALLVQEVKLPLTVGFAWKTDLVGWTEGHPYQLRDDIRASGTVTTLEPLGPNEIGTLLGRLEKAAGSKLNRDLRRRLREYSQGLPWLFKKLGGHIIAELKGGVTQEDLVRDALNVQALFEADLAELTPAEQEAIRTIARVAPVAISDLEERIASPVLQALLNKRLAVQVGEQIDTYWDTFRDFLVTGRVAVEDSYTVRFGPVSVGKLLRRLIAAGGTLTVPAAAAELNTSPAVVFNLSRELRQFGLVVTESNRLSADAAVLAAADPETLARERTSAALRRHQIVPIVNELIAESTGPVAIDRLARELPAAFPAVEAQHSSWVTYARAFSQWLAYAGLAMLDKDGLRRADEKQQPQVFLLAGAAPVRMHGFFPQSRARPAEQLLLHIADPASNPRPDAKRFRPALRDLAVLGAVTPDARDSMVLTRPDLVTDGVVNQGVIEELARAMPGVSDAMDALIAEPWKPPIEIGQILREATGATWKDETTKTNGGFLRSWAQFCGVETRLKPPAPTK